MYVQGDIVPGGGGGGGGGVCLQLLSSIGHRGVRLNDGIAQYLLAFPISIDFYV